MRDLIFRIRSSQYLSNNEIVAIKVIFVSVLLFIIGSIAVPINVLFSGVTFVQIAFPLAFVLTFLSTVILNALSKPRLAMNASIYSFGIIAASFLPVASPLYTYLIFFGILAILIFYQDFYSFAIHGTIVTLFGVGFMLLNFETFGSGLFETNQTIQIVIYQGTLIIFYVFFLIHFIYGEVVNERYIKSFLESKSYTNSYIELILKLKDSMNDKDKISPIYDRPQFQQALLEVSTFLGEIFGFKAKEVQEMVEFYLYLHEVDPDLIIQKKEINVKTRSYAKQLKRYLINHNNEFMGLAYEMISETQKGLDAKVEDLELKISNSYFTNTDRFIAVLTIYYYLRTEVTQLDKWGRTDEVLTHQSVKNIIQNSHILNYFDASEINFIIENEELLRRII